MTGEDEIDLGGIHISALNNPAIRHALTLYVLARVTNDLTDPDSVRIPKGLKPLWDALKSKADPSGSSTITREYFCHRARIESMSDSTKEINFRDKDGKPQRVMLTGGASRFAKTPSGHVYERGTRHNCGVTDCPAYSMAEEPAPYGIGIVINLTNTLDHWPKPTVADVVVAFNGVAKQFTYAEFLKACGFDTEPPHEHTWLDARNEFVEDGEFCRCGAIRAGNEATQRKGERS